MERKHYVYALFRPDTCEIFYIGMGQGKRFNDHVKNRKRGRSYKDNLICKIIDDLGYPDIPVFFLGDGMTREEACDLEIALIYAIGRHPHGPLVNKTKGGDGLVEPCLELRNRMGLSQRGRKHSNETKAKIAAASKGRKQTKESIEKTRQYNLGRKRSEEVKEKIRLKAIGRKASDEVRAKMSANRKGRKQSQDIIAKRVSKIIGRKYTDEHKNKIGASRKGKVWITDGKINKVVNPSNIPDGWVRGKVWLCSAPAK